MREIEIDRPGSEASALLAIENRSILEAHGWSDAFWTCTDEEPVEKALGALGKGADGWDLIRPRKIKTSPAHKTEDCEGMARWRGWVYIFGSHFGTKAGSLEPRRHFIARFNEARLQGPLDEARVEIEVSRGSFKLHRLINDALQDSGLLLLPPGDAVRDCIRKTRQRGREKGKKWVSRIHKDDLPVNIEGVAFRPSGNLLLGLRYPVTRDGHPILVELDRVEKLFRDPAGDLSVRHLWVLHGVGSADKPRGIRGLETVGDELHVITGSLDSGSDESAILQDHPEGERAGSWHHRLTLPEVRLWGRVDSKLVKELGSDSRVEGIASDTQGEFWYVLDDEKVRLQRAG